MRLHAKSIARAFDQERVERRAYDKLIRDHIPKLMVTDGVLYQVDLLDAVAFRAALLEVEGVGLDELRGTQEGRHGERAGLRWRLVLRWTETG